MENRDRILQKSRTEIITQGLEEGKGERAIQLEIEQLETKDLSLRSDEVSKEIARITKDLRSPELAEGVRRVLIAPLMTTFLTCNRELKRLRLKPITC